MRKRPVNGSSPTPSPIPHVEGVVRRAPAPLSVERKQTVMLAALRAENARLHYEAAAKDYQAILGQVSVPGFQFNDQLEYVPAPEVAAPAGAPPALRSM